MLQELEEQRPRQADEIVLYRARLAKEDEYLANRLEFDCVEPQVNHDLVEPFDNACFHIPVAEPFPG